MPYPDECIKWELLQYDKSKTKFILNLGSMLHGTNGYEFHLIITNYMFIL
jgi:hypothetical protein